MKPVHLAIALSCAAFIFICLLITKSLDDGQSALRAELEYIAEDTSEILPKMLDSGTRWDSIKALDTSLVNSYTLINTRKADIDHAIFVRSMRASMIEKMCHREEMKFLSDNDVSVLYKYFDSEGESVAILSFTPADCSKAS